jgi:hypothetical protein
MMKAYVALNKKEEIKLLLATESGPFTVKVTVGHKSTAV